MKEKRRDFLKKSALATIGVSVVAKAIGENEDNYPTKCGHNKKDVLYTRSANWQLYYEKAE